MHRTLILLVLAALLLGAPSLPAQDSALEKRLARGLQLFPEADGDGDGKLSMEEAVAYLNKHPELQSLLGAGAGTRKNTPQNSPDSPPAPVTPAVTPGTSTGTRIFVCAHSFMIYTAALLPPMAEAAGVPYAAAGQQMIGGSRVVQHWNLPDAQNKAKAALTAGAVDVLTLSPHILLPDEGIDHFTRLGLEKNPGLRVFVQASWPARDGDLSRNFLNEKRNEATLESLRRMHESFCTSWRRPLEDQVRALNAAVGREAVFIVPVCDAVLALRERIAEGTAPGLARQTDLFRDNLGHPHVPLAVLVTYCHFAAIYGRSPEGLPVPSELKAMPRAEELNALLQQIAWRAVTDYPMSGVKAAPAATAP